MLPTRFHVPRRTQDTTRFFTDFNYRTCTFFGLPFNAIRLSFRYHVVVLLPRLAPVWAAPISLATTFGITVVFFSSRY